MATFLIHFLIFTIYCQHTIIIPYALFTNSILVSFDRPLCNHNQSIFLIISLISLISLANIYKSTSVCLTLGLKNSFPSLSLCFKVVFSVAFPFPLFPKFTIFSDTVIKNIILWRLTKVLWNILNNLQQMHKPQFSFWTPWPGIYPGSFDVR